MTNNRARSYSGKIFNFETTGCFGRYAVGDNLPIEFITTTMNINEISNLSFAKDIRTSLDFELLIQRDIDESRAQKEIGRYISQENNTNIGSKENNGVFLPPLIAAIVDTDDGKTISSSYPDVDTTLDKDDYGKTLSRQWGNLFKIELYEDASGGEYKFEKNGSSDTLLIALRHSKLEMKIGHNSEIGGRLVVIDGQHRLFALNFLRTHSEHQEKVKDLVIPICILFSPKSTKSNIDAGIPRIPDVLRKLFVDVNNNAKTVSGHFRILLSNDDVGQMLCNKLCSHLLQMGLLPLLEWNTKNDKESKTISKKYTVSSIGVIYDALHDLFKSKNGKPLLNYILNIEEIEGQLDFGENGDGEPNPQSRDFPWRDIPYNNKEALKGQVSKYFAECLKIIFFDTPEYRKITEIFNEKKRTVLESKLKDDVQAIYAKIVLGHLDQFESLGSNKQVEAILTEFVEEVTTSYKKRGLNEIIRANVFQKGVLTAWFQFLRIGSEYNLKPIDATKIFSDILQFSLAQSLFDNDVSHQYLQDSIFEGIRIRASKDARLQISRLILSVLGNASVSGKIADGISALDDAVNGDELRSSLVMLGDNNATFYLNNLHSQLVKTLSKEYRSRSNLSQHDISELRKLEEKKELSKKVKRTQPGAELDESFDIKIKEHIKPSFELAKSQLDKVLSFVTVCDELLQEESVEE